MKRGVDDRLFLVLVVLVILVATGVSLAARVTGATETPLWVWLLGVAYTCGLILAIPGWLFRRVKPSCEGDGDTDGGTAAFAVLEHLVLWPVIALIVLLGLYLPVLTEAGARYVLREMGLAHDRAFFAGCVTASWGLATLAHCVSLFAPRVAAWLDWADRDARYFVPLAVPWAAPLGALHHRVARRRASGKAGLMLAGVLWLGALALALTTWAATRNENRAALVGLAAAAGVVAGRRLGRTLEARTPGQEREPPQAPRALWRFAVVGLGCCSAGVGLSLLGGASADPLAWPILQVVAVASTGPLWLVVPGLPREGLGARLAFAVTLLAIPLNYWPWLFVGG